MKKILLLLILLIPFSVKAYDEAVVDINNLSIKELQEYVDKGYLTYEKITKLYLDRIEAYNEQYNALITINENALSEAKKLDMEYKLNGRKSLIYGLPVIVKDNIDVKGLPTTNGTKALLDSIPYENAPVVQKLIDNGAIVIAKANMDEFAFNAAYSHSSFGYVKNAFNTLYSSYGSSGGSAVGVSANLAVYALGSDTGCSVRVPSSANGVVGIRPSYDIMNGDGVIKFDSTRDVVGVITKYVEDSAIVLDIIDDVDTKYTDYLTDNLDGITIGVIKGFMNPYSQGIGAYGKTDMFVYNMMNESIKTLEDLGAKIVYIDSFYLNYKFDATPMCYEFNEYIKNTSSKIKSLDDLIKNGGYTQYIDSYNGYYCYNDYKQTSAYKNYLANRNNNINTANTRFDNYKIDAVIYPTLKTKLIKLDSIWSERLYTPSSDLAPLVGYPAMTVPMGFNDEFPYGMEIVSKSKNESIIYKIASAYQSKNKVYKTPSIAPSLYEVKEDVTKLLTYYDNYKDNKAYTNINNEVLEYIKNYSYDETKINELITKYESPIENGLKTNAKEINIILYSLLLLACVYILKKVVK